jgi:hypothetical protein
VALPEPPAGDIVVADDWNALVAGRVRNPINRDQNGELLSPGEEAGVWTNTSFDGTVKSKGEDCNGWTTNGIGPGYIEAVFSSTGNAHAYAPNWTDDEASIHCSSFKRIYCFEQ